MINKNKIQSTRISRKVGTKDSAKKFLTRSKVDWGKVTVAALRRVK